jgi:hypothetical protein
MTNPFAWLSASNGSDLNEKAMTDDGWRRRGHEQAMAMSNGLPWQESSADGDGDPTGGDLDGDYNDLTHANECDKIDDEHYEARFEQLAWRAVGRETPKVT